MSTISLRLPNFLHKEVKGIAKEEGISINQFIATALAEKMSALRTQEYLEDVPQEERGINLKKHCPKLAIIILSMKTILQLNNCRPHIPPPSENDNRTWE